MSGDKVCPNCGGTDFEWDVMSTVPFSNVDCSETLQVEGSDWIADRLNQGALHG
jgi:hypothetical protein